MSTTHHRTRIRAIIANSLTVMARSTTGPRSIIQDPPFFMKARPSPTTRTCDSSTMPRRIDRCQC